MGRRRPRFWRPFAFDVLIAASIVFFIVSPLANRLAAAARSPSAAKTHATSPRYPPGIGLQTELEIRRRLYGRGETLQDTMRFRNLSLEDLALYKEIRRS